jgi:hypothetical protein
MCIEPLTSKDYPQAFQNDNENANSIFTTSLSHKLLVEKKPNTSLIAYYGNEYMFTSLKCCTYGYYKVSKHQLLEKIISHENLYLLRNGSAYGIW